MYTTVPVPVPGIGIWIGQLPTLQDRYESARNMLSREELDRAASFYFEKDRLRFVLSRGMLRELLGHHLQQAPDALIFSFNTFGKPMLIPSAEGKSIQFNLSHSADLISVILSNDPVGIDIEQIRPDMDTDPLVRNYFSTEEAAAYFSVPPERRNLLFFRIWTRKEAFIKATGQGLMMPLKRFSVMGDDPGTPSFQLRTSDGLYELFDIDPGKEGYVGAFCREVGLEGVFSANV
jgi:4'-phosphopantetheinyl transferase